MKTRIVSHSFALLFAKKHDKLLIHNNRRQERIHVSVAARSSRLASYSAADPRNDFSVCRAGTRTESHTVGRRSDCTTLRRSLACISFRINYRSYCQRTVPGYGSQSKCNRGPSNETEVDQLPCTS